MQETKKSTAENSSNEDKEAGSKCASSKRGNQIWMKAPEAFLKGVCLWN